MAVNVDFDYFSRHSEGGCVFRRNYGNFRSQSSLQPGLGWASGISVGARQNNVHFLYCSCGRRGNFSLRYRRRLNTGYTTTTEGKGGCRMCGTSVLVFVLRFIDLCDELFEIRLVDHQYIGVERAMSCPCTGVLLRVQESQAELAAPRSAPSDLVTRNKVLTFSERRQNRCFRSSRSRDTSDFARLDTRGPGADSSFCFAC